MNSDSPRLLDQVRQALRRKHYSMRTEEAYVSWIKRYMLFHDKRHPRDMGAPEVTAFLTHLAVDEQVAASTQNQALAALLFLYRNVMNQPLEGTLDAVRAKQPHRPQPRRGSPPAGGGKRDAPLDGPTALWQWATLARMPTPADQRPGRHLSPDHRARRQRPERPPHDAARHPGRPVATPPPAGADCTPGRPAARLWRG